MTWQHCERFKPKSECADDDEKKAFFDDIKVTLEIAENYVQFNEPETEAAIQTRIVETLRVDTARDDIRNVKGLVLLTPNEVDFMDTWYSWYPDADTVTKYFMTVE